MRNSPDTSILETASAAASSMGAELSATVDGARELARAAARLADQRVHERPWQIALIAGALGIVLGLCVRTGR